MRSDVAKGGESILRGAREALAYARGEVTEGFVVHPGDAMERDDGPDG